MSLCQMLQLIETLKEQAISALRAHWYDSGRMSCRKVSPINPRWRKQISQLGGHTYEVSLLYYRAFVIKTKSAAQCVLYRFDV